MKNCLRWCLVACTAFLFGSVVQAVDWAALNADSRQEALTVLRPGVPKESAFWNVNARAFIHPPALAFEEVTGAVNYRITVTEEATGLEHAFVAVKPWAPLTEVWDAIPPGYVTVRAEGLDATSAVLGEATCAGATRFWRAAPFAGPYPRGLRPYAEAAKKVYAGVFNQPYVQHWATNPPGPSASYDLYCYPAKTIPAIIKAVLKYAESNPDARETAHLIARNAADWLIGVSAGADATLPYLPPTYWGEARDVARQYAGQNMLVYPAWVALAYLDLHEATRNSLYYTAAKNIATTMKNLQQNNGTWWLKVNEESGNPVTQNLMIPDDKLFELFERFAVSENDPTFTQAAANARNYILHGPYLTWNWEGQFEDAEPSVPYANLAKDRSVSLAMWMFGQNRVDEAKTLLAWSEDQFCVWSDPLPNGSESSAGWILPAGLEQYVYYTPIDASTADFIRGFTAAAKKTNDPLALEKAKALADNVTRMQRADGTIPTYFSARQSSDWVNCMVYTAEALEALSEIVSGERTDSGVWIDQPFGTYTTGHEGGATRDPSTGEWTVTGSGANFCGGDTNDGGRFVFRPVDGDFIFTCEVKAVASNNGANRWTRAGLMIRNSSDVRSDLASIFRRGGDADNDITNIKNVRADQRNAGQETYAGEKSLYGSTWMRMRLIRRGTTVYAYAASESAPDDWVLVATETAQFGDRVLAGFFVTKTGSCLADEATCHFRNPSITPIVDLIPANGQVAMLIENDLPFMNYKAIEDSFAAWQGGDRNNFWITRYANGLTAATEVYSRKRRTTTFTDTAPVQGVIQYQAFVNAANYEAHVMGASEHVWNGSRGIGVPMPVVNGLTETALPDNLTLREGTIRATASGLHTFVVRASGTVSLAVDGESVLNTTLSMSDKVGDRIQTFISNPIRLEAGRAVPFVLGTQPNGDAAVELLWALPGASELQTIPATAFEPVLAGWSTRDLGVPAGGATAYDAGTGVTTLSVAGAPERTTFDAARFLYQKVTSSSGFLRDFAAEATLQAPASGTRAEGGLMVTAGLEGPFPHVGLSLRPNGGALDLVYSQRASTSGARVEQVVRQGLSGADPIALRFERRDLDMAFSVKVGAGEWERVQTVDAILPMDVYVGAFAQTAGDGVASVCVANPSLTIGGEWETRPLEADAFVQDGSAHGLAQAYLLVGDTRESILRFDATGLENASTVLIRMYCTQHPEGAVKPFIFRVMRDVTWSEATASFSNMKHEIPFMRSPWIGADDPLYAGSGTVRAQGDWLQVDITEATKREAARTGKVSLHLFTPESHAGGIAGNGMVDSFTSREGEVVANRPLIAFKRPAPDPVVAETVELYPTDVVTLEDTNNTRVGDLVVSSPRRDAFIKFDLSEYAGSIKRAVLRLVATENNGNPATRTEFKLVGNNWSQKDIEMGSPSTYPSGATVHQGWNNSVPPNTIRMANVIPSATNDIDVTSLARLGGQTDKQQMTLQIYNNGAFSIFWGPNDENKAVRPRLIIELGAECRPAVSTDGATGCPSLTWGAMPNAARYRVERATDPQGPFTAVEETTATAFIDATCPGAAQWWYRVVAIGAGGEEIVSDSTFYQTTAIPEQRPAIRQASAFFNDENKSGDVGVGPTDDGTVRQIGNPDHRTILAYFLFDPKGLEHAPYVRLRVHAKEDENTQHNQTAELRAFGAVTDLWNPYNVCWNSGLQGFEHFKVNNTTSQVPGKRQPNEIGRIQYAVSTQQPMALEPYMELDVTELVHEAARQGRYATIQLTGSNGGFWRWIYSLNSSTPPVLLYPPATGFGEEMTVETDWTSEPPSAVVNWRGGLAGTTYTVERQVVGKSNWTMLAENATATTCVDAKAYPGAAIAYRVTATLPNGQTIARTVTNELDVAQRVYAEADTYIYDGQGNSSFGTARAIVMKDGELSGGTREGLARFDISSIPANAVDIRLVIAVTGSEKFDGDETLYFRVGEDYLWTDATAPSWNAYFSTRGKRATEPSDGYFASSRAIGTEPLANGTEIAVNAQEIVKAAQATGKSNLTLHFYLDDPNQKSANFGIITRENPLGDVKRPYLTWTIPSWHSEGTMLFFR